MDEERFLADLNEEQQRAVLHRGGPVLVQAGAGSGKTRVITYRIAHLVKFRTVPPGEIIAVTFTNKAADEMKERVEALIGLKNTVGMWVGTFHAFCLRILRKEGALLGYRNNFLVYDAADQLALVKECMQELSVDDSDISPREALSMISSLKNRLVPPETYLKSHHGKWERIIGEIYSRYQKKLFQNNSMDFDDMITRTLELFSKHHNVRKRYATGCKHLLVDEYQDTNHSQYLLIRDLSSVHSNLCCVGDEDQSIYGFRGADIHNILRFKSDFRDATIIKLEKNYRSTKTILSAASAVVRNNIKRIGKELWTDNESGDSIPYYRGFNDLEEADYIAEKMMELTKRYPADSIAVLYRTNAQSRLIEESFRNHAILYQIVGSVQFYERKEIKDIVAYLRVIANPSDNLSLVRVINIPPRGIGKATLEMLLSLASTQTMTLLDAVRHFSADAGARSKTKRSMQEFLDTLEELRSISDKEKLSSFVKKVIKKFHYKKYLQKNFPDDSDSRIENIDSFVSAAAEYEESTEEPTLQGFIDRSSLRSDQDDLKREKLVSLMTVHCAKGLEYPVVFIAGLEENLFPHMRAQASADEIEEERRLFYVALTRAQKLALLSSADARRIGGTFMNNPPSRFLFEIPKEFLMPQTSRYKKTRLPILDEEREYVWGTTSSSAAKAARLRDGIQTVKKRRKMSSDSPYHEGQSVIHPKFGRGKVLDCEGSGDSLKVTVHFHNSGTKKILVKYTTLTPVKC